MSSSSGGGNAVLKSSTFKTGRLAAVPIAFLGVFFAFPVGSILWRGLTVGGTLDFGVFTDVASDPFMRGIAWFTLWQAVVSTVLTLALGLPVAYVVSHYEFPGRRLFRAVITVPFVLPTVVVGTAFLVLFSPSGPVGWDLRQTIWAVLIAHVFFNVSIVVRTVGGAWGQLHPGPEEAARVLGASRWRTFRSVTSKRLAPAIGAASSIVFLFTFTSFGVVLILGGPGLSTLESETYYQTTRLLNLDTAAVLALTQMFAVVVLLLVQRRLQGRFERSQRAISGGRERVRVRTWNQRLLVGGVLFITLAIVLAPMLVLVWRSLRVGDRWGLDFYDALDESRRGSTLFVAPTQAIWNSLKFAAAATLLAVGVGGLAATAIARGGGRVARALDTGLMLPLGTSAATVGFGFLIAFDQDPVNFRSSVWLIPAAHALVGIPFVIRIMVPALRAVDDQLRSAARVLGASPARVFREVDLPIISRSIFVAGGFAFAVSLGEFGATSFIARPQHPTIPTAIFRFLGQPGSANLGQAMAMSVILMVLTAVVVLTIDRFRLGEFGEW
ncbi:MAG: thiamine transport system permease protein [Candidatus Poriferisodalaceae bacterium]|jgi:thiamine transport system permease protein